MHELPVEYNNRVNSVVSQICNKQFFCGSRRFGWKLYRHYELNLTVEIKSDYYLINTLHVEIITSDILIIQTDSWPIVHNEYLGEVPVKPIDNWLWNEKPTPIIARPYDYMFKHLKYPLSRSIKSEYLGDLSEIDNIAMQLWITAD